MRNKVICFFNSSKTWGGGEKWHYDMALEMHKKGYKVIVFTNLVSELYNRLKNTGIKVYPTKVTNLSFLNPFKIKKIAEIFKKTKITTIIINLSSDLKLAGFAAKKTGVKNIIYRRGSAIPIKNRFLNRKIFKNIITDIIANTEATKNTINQNNPELFPENKIKVIYNGIKIEELDKQNYTKKEKTDNQLIIGNIGRLVKQKAQHYFIDLAKELKNKNINFKIIIGGEGKIKQNLENICKSNNLENEIIFIGFVDNTKDFLENIDIFVLPSLWEGFGYVLVEAMACKKPTIAFNISSNPEIIEHNKTGFLIEPFDIKKMSEKIIYLSENPKIMEEFGENARKRAIEKFTFEKSFYTFEHFINSLKE